MEIIWKKFNALGTEIVLLAQLPQSKSYILDTAEAKIFELENRLSRFKANSELSMFNNFPGGAYEASPLFIDIIKRCQNYYHSTNGLFDPTIIDILEASGYRKNFSEAVLDQVNYAQAVSDRETAIAKFQIRTTFDKLSVEGGTIIKPASMHLDFGGIGKGYIADLLASEVFADVESFWISLGGDLLVRGNDKEGAGWKIKVEHPLFPGQTSFTINTLGETLGIATSGTQKRKGINGGLKWHHLINPRTGESMKTEIVSVTVVAPTAEEADVYAKTVLLLGREDGLEFINNRPNLECAIYFKEGQPIFSDGLIKYL